MLSRALLVLLIVINLGVAVWWLARAPAASSAAPPVPAGVPELQLLREAGTPAVAVRRCLKFGPFRDPVLLASAQAQLQGLAIDRRVVALPENAPAPDTWRVLLPPAPDGRQARELAARIDGAGFDDYMVVADGPEANSIALGLFGTQAAARTRQAALQAAGFDAQVHPDGGESVFLGVALAGTADAARSRHQVGALRAEPVDCASLR